LTGASFLAYLALLMRNTGLGQTRIALLLVVLVLTGDTSVCAP
jgi:hypothetical protein